jgi:hypothetical protein
MTLQVEKVNAQKAFETANEEGKKLLLNLFGAHNFLQHISDRIKSFEDACAVLNVSVPNFLKCTNDPFGDNAAAIAFDKLTTIARALNEGWTPDWSNPSQNKYYPYFKANPSGSGLSFYGVDYWNSGTHAGSRLCFKSRELAEYAGKQFIELYNDFLTIKQS